MDLGSLSEVRTFARWFKTTEKKLNFLIHNAGIAPKEYTKSEDNFELTIQVNYLAPYLLTELLLPCLTEEFESRVICISSNAHFYMDQLRKPDLQLRETGYLQMMAYAHSKLAMAMYARELSKRMKNDGVIAVSIHPGIIDSELVRSAVRKTLPKQFSIDGNY